MEEQLRNGGEKLREGREDSRENYERAKYLVVTVELGGRRSGGVQQSSQHLSSHSFVRASLNMDGVWSRVGASGTPQTAPAAWAGPFCCHGPPPHPPHTHTPALVLPGAAILPQDDVAQHARRAG